MKHLVSRKRSISCATSKGSFLTSVWVLKKSGPKSCNSSTFIGLRHKRAGSGLVAVVGFCTWFRSVIGKSWCFPLFFQKSGSRRFFHRSSLKHRFSSKTLSLSRILTHRYQRCYAQVSSDACFLIRSCLGPVLWRKYLCFAHLVCSTAVYKIGCKVWFSRVVL